MSEPPRSAASLGGDLRRFAVIALALPAGVVAVDHLLPTTPLVLSERPVGDWLFYPWLVVKTALLAWCAGKFLGPTLYGWILFFWGQALVDAQTFHASAGFLGHSWDGLEQSLVAAQASFLAAWGILGKTALPWRLTCTLLAATVIVRHATSLILNWHVRALPSVLLIAVGIFVALCCLLRIFGVVIQPWRKPGERAAEEPLQFGVKHMLIWTAAMAPLLLVVRGFDYGAFRQLGSVDVEPALLIAGCTAATALATLWLVLGNKRLFLRVMLLAITIVSATAAMYVETAVLRPLYSNWPEPYAVRLAVGMQGLWASWFGLVSCLLAAMLLFLRASGFRLARAK